MVRVFLWKLSKSFMWTDKDRGRELDTTFVWRSSMNWRGVKNHARLRGKLSGFERRELDELAQFNVPVGQSLSLHSCALVSWSLIEPTTNKQQVDKIMWTTRDSRCKHATNCVALLNILNNYMEYHHNQWQTWGETVKDCNSDEDHFSQWTLVWDYRKHQFGFGRKSGMNTSHTSLNNVLCHRTAQPTERNVIFRPGKAEIVGLRSMPVF